MREPAEDQGSIPEEQWRVWAHMARRRQEAEAKIRHRHAGIVAAALVIGLASYFLTLK